MLRGVNIHKSYNSLNVLKGVDLQVEQGEIVSIVGASGAGKSTLLHIMGTLDKADSGKVFLGETDTTALNKNELAALRNKRIGFIFQFHNLLPEFTALENVCIPGFMSKTPEKEIRLRAENLMEQLGLASRRDHKPGELSGGEQQRTAVARALINSPDVVFADEPSGNLDSKNAKELHELFFRLRKEMNQTFVIVTHNMELARMADRTLEIKDGRILL